jgi:hypothetical protein
MKTERIVLSDSVLAINKVINAFIGNFSNITFRMENVSPAFCALRPCLKSNGVRFTKWREDLNLNPARKLTFWDVVPKISAVNLKVSDGQRLRKALVALTSELRVHFSINHTCRYRKSTAYKNKQIPLGSQRNQSAWVRTPLGNPCRKLGSHARPELNSISNLPKLIYPLRRDLCYWNLPEASNQRIEITGTMILEIFSHLRQLVFGVHKAVGQKPYGLRSLVSLHSHQLEQALLPLFSRQFKVTNREIASRHNRDDRTNCLNPISSTTPLSCHAPGSGNHADQSNEWDRECQKDRTLPEGISPLGRYILPFSCFAHSRSPNIPATEMGVSMGAAA